MIWPFEPIQRTSRHGFTLLEALISIALVAMTMGAVLVVLAQSSANQRQRMDRLLLTEFAYSKLEEWSVAGKLATEANGTAEGWNWRITEESTTPNPPSSLDGSMGYLRISVEVWTDLQPKNKVDLQTIVARRLP